MASRRQIAASPRLDRTARGRPAAPVRIVHLGLGNFARAHTFWYTEHAPDAAGWGVAGFTGRRPDVADGLRGQDGLYTLVIRDADGDRFDVVSALSAVHAATEHDAFRRYLTDPAVALLTTTVTEAGYVRAADGGLDVSDERVAADLARVAADRAAPAATVPVRIAAGLAARRDAGAGPVTVLPCDNLVDNGAMLARVVGDAAALIDPALPGWVADHVAWATCMVDRITPATTDRERQDVLEATGYVDASPVPTEPFSEWVISGRFPAGRPAWEEAGALVVDDVEPFENRKLRMLNGAHSLQAYAGSIRGHETVAEAIGDPMVRRWVEEWWDAVARHLTVPSGDYRESLRHRFGNPRIQHRLAQIAADGSQKLPVRVLPVIRAERAAGSLADGALRPVAAWVQHLRGLGAPVTEAALPDGLRLAGADVPTAVDRVLRHLDPGLAADGEICRRVARLSDEIAR